MRLLRELSELEERETDHRFEDGITNVTRFFRVSQATYAALVEWGGYAAVLPFAFGELGHFYAISVAAFEEDGRWNGWDWLHDELLGAGLEPAAYGL